MQRYETVDVVAYGNNYLVTLGISGNNAVVNSDAVHIMNLVLDKVQGVATMHHVVHYNRFLPLL
ncbi:MAG: hypothetical protein KGI33_04410 [Thaumarchaeota archaeon]|nr:hypothetical protein [Nitrososphaerota archaeon]